MFNGLSFLSKDDSDFENFLSGAASNDNSNLADLFETDDPKASLDLNATLKYVPPKTKLPLPKSTDKTTWNVIIVKIVGAFKLVSEVNSPLGQLGMALLQNQTKTAHKLILYKTKDHILSTLLLTKASKLYWKEPYLQYHDDLNGFWSVLFGNDIDTDDFFVKLDEVCTIDRDDGAQDSSDRKPETNETKPSTNEAIIDSDKLSDAKESEGDVVDATATKSIKTPKSKSDVVYRVAKIGHQLPKINPVNDYDSDSSNLPSDVEKVPRMQSLKTTYHIPDKSESTHKSANISVALQPSAWPSTSTFDLNSFASESRIQHTEVRVNLTKLDTKLDRVLDNIERLRLSSSKTADVSDREDEIIKLEEKMLELKKENRLLKLHLAESEQSAKSNVNKNEEEFASLQKSNEEKDSKISSISKELQEMEQALKSASETNEKEKAALIEKHTAEMDNLREDLVKKTNEIETLKQIKSSTENHGDTIRNIMNQFYLQLYQSISEKDTVTSAEILKLTAELIRKETKAALNAAN